MMSQANIAWPNSQNGIRYAMELTISFTNLDVCKYTIRAFQMVAGGRI